MEGPPAICLMPAAMAAAAAAQTKPTTALADISSESAAAAVKVGQPVEEEGEISWWSSPEKLSSASVVLLTITSDLRVV